MLSNKLITPIQEPCLITSIKLVKKKLKILNPLFYEQTQDIQNINFNLTIWLLQSKSIKITFIR